MPAFAPVVEGAISCSPSPYQYPKSGAPSVTGLSWLSATRNIVPGTPRPAGGGRPAGANPPAGRGGQARGREPARHRERRSPGPARARRSHVHAAPSDPVRDVLLGPGQIVGGNARHHEHVVPVLRQRPGVDGRAGEAVEGHAPLLAEREP